MLTPMNEGAYLVNGCLSVIDKEDKRIAVLNRRKRTVKSLWICSTRYVGEVMPLILVKASLTVWTKKRHPKPCPGCPPLKDQC